MDGVKIMKMIKPNEKQLKYLLIGAVVIVVLAFSGSSANKYLKKQKKVLTTQISDLKEVNLKLNDSLGFYFDFLNALDQDEFDYKKEYIYEYNRRVRAERNLKALKNKKFPKKYLDSLKNSVLYE